MIIEAEDEFGAAFGKSNAAVSAVLNEAEPSQTEDTTDGSIAAPAPEALHGEGAAPEAAPAAPAPAAASAPAAEAPPAPAATAPAPAPADDDNDPVKLRARLSTVQGMLRAKSDELAAVRAAPPAPPAPAPAPAAPPTPSAEDLEADELLNELKESAPTIYNAMTALMKKDRAAIERTFEDRVAKRVEEVTGRLKPIEEKHAELSDAEHFAEIAKKHSDWEAVVVSPELITWVQSQPTWTQQHFARVAESGTPAEVIEVLDQFRTAHPASAPSPAPAPSAAPAAPAPAPAAPSAHDARREAQKRALGTQPGRSAPVAPSGSAAKPADFDSAFDAAASRSAPELT